MRRLRPELTLFHTSVTHVERFRALLEVAAPGTPARHLVNEGLLADAIANGMTPELEVAVAAEIDPLASVSRVVLCTCSTLGGLAEGLDGRHGARIVRVDRPLAARAVATGRRIAVVASVESTLAPTGALILEEAARAGRDIELATAVVEGAWDRFKAGDTAGYLELTGALADRLAPDADVVVLAQASMEGAELFVTSGVPVLSSPAVGVAYALRLLNASR